MKAAGNVSFFVEWVLGHTLVFYPSNILSAQIGRYVRIAIWPGFPDPPVRAVAIIVSALVEGIFYGLAIGIIQYIILARHGVNVKGWAFDSAAGWGVGLMLSALAGVPKQPFVAGAFATLGEVSGIGLAAGLQSRRLQAFAPSARRWWLTYPAAWLIAVIFAGILQTIIQVTAANRIGGLTVPLILAGISGDFVFGIISGRSLMRIVPLLSTAQKRS